MQMHFLNTKLLEEKCANCTCSFDKKNLRATKLKVSREKPPSQEMEIQILDALAFIYQTSRNEFANTLAHFIEDEENETILPTTADSLTVALCCQCVPILAEMYNAHRNFNRLSKADSIISKVKTYQGRQILKMDSPITFSEAEEFGENLFDDLTYDDNQALCSEMGDNLDFRYEYDVLADFPQLLPTAQCQTNSVVETESQTEKGGPISKGILPLTFSISKACDDSILERKIFSGGTKIGLLSNSQFGLSIPLSAANDRMTRRMTRQLGKDDDEVAAKTEEKKHPVATSTITHSDIDADDGDIKMSFDFKMNDQNVSELGNNVFQESNEVSNIEDDEIGVEPTDSSVSLPEGEYHSTINIEQLEEISGSQQLSISSHGNIGSENGSPGSEESTSAGERNRKSGGRIPCSVCGQKICQDNMRGHMKIHAAVRETFKCELCDKVYLHKRNLRVHTKSHNKQRQEVSCQYCNKVYATLILLKCHEEVHHEEDKPYSCEFCQMKFRKRRELEVHAPVHSTERPFNCEECGNNFKRKKDLRRHERIHSDSRMDKEAFKCEDCGKLLRHSFSLYKHRVKYHRQRQ